MIITPITSSNSIELVELFSELEDYYFGCQAASKSEIETYFSAGLFAPHSGVQVVGAKVDGDILAFASYSILYPAPRLSGQLFMKDLFVSKRARGQGLGRALMVYLAREALDKGCLRMDWTAESTNPNAGRFYQAMGAALIEEKQYFRFDGMSLKQFASSN